MKQRLIGAIVLILLAVIFLPMLVQDPAPESGVGDIPLRVPAEPGAGVETRELPLTGPGETPAGGAVGMPGAPPLQEPAPAAPTGGMQPAATAAGDYAVSFGAYATRADADIVATQLRKSQLPGYVESTTVAGTPAWRVRVGNFATRAEAEAARLRALHVRDDVNAKVVTLDAAAATAADAADAGTPGAAKAAATPVAETPVSKPAPATPVAKPDAVAKPANPAPATAPTPAAAVPAKPPASLTGFAVQLGAFGSAAEAAALRDRARAAGFSAFTESVDTEKGALTRVRVGPVADRAAADALKAQVQAKLGVAGMVRPHP